MQTTYCIGKQAVMTPNKTISLFMACTMIVPALSMAQSSKKQEVEQAVQALTKAMIDADGPTLRKLTDDALSYGHSSGKVETKSEFVETLVTSVSVFEDIQLENQTVDVVDNTAIVRHILSATTNDKGKGPGSVKLGVVLVWVKKESQWKLLARQAVKVP